MTLLAPPPTAPARTPPRRQPLSELLNFFPRQVEALRAVERHTFTLYGGAAGGGKSRFLRWLAVVLLVRWARRGFRGVRVGLFSVDYPTLHDRQLSKIRAEFPDWLGTFNESAREFRLSPSYGGGVICFRNLDDPSKYKSAEFAAILVDELTESEQGVFDLLRFRLRWPGIDDTRFVGATNPGGIGHHWCKSIWIDRSFPEELHGREGEFKYVKATALDNPYNSPTYLRELDSLPEALRKAYKDGNWDVFLGQMFGEFDRTVHTIAPFTIPRHWTRWMANDPGFKDPSTWYWLAADEKGFVYCYRERTFTDTTSTEQAKAIAAINTAGKEKPQFIVTGMDAFVVQDRTIGKTDVDYYEQGGLSGFVQPVHGMDARSARAKTLHEYLRPFDYPYDPDDPRKIARIAKLRIFNDCRKLILTLPALPIDDHDREAVKECTSDHWYDALGYGLQAWHAARSYQPKVPMFEKGTAGDVLKHASKLGAVKVGVRDPFKG